MYNLTPPIKINPENAFAYNNRANSNYELLNYESSISDYTKDSRVNQITGDPHSSIYISKKVKLIQPATSLKVVLNSYRNDTSDIRVLYQLFGDEKGYL